MEPTTVLSSGNARVGIYGNVDASCLCRYRSIDRYEYLIFLLTVYVSWFNDEPCELCYHNTEVVETPLIFYPNMVSVFLQDVSEHKGRELFETLQS